MQRKLTTIDSYASYGNTYGDYLKKKGYKVEHITGSNYPPQMFPNKFQVIKNELIAIFKFTLKINKLKNATIYCRGCHFAILFIFSIFAYKLKESHLYIHNFYLHSLSKNIIVQHILTILLRPHNITLLLQHPTEEKYYKRLSKHVKTYFVPYCSDFFPKKYKKREIGNYIFTGGYTNRDYELVEKLAKLYPHEQFVIVASELNKINPDSKNITLYNHLQKNKFEDLLSKSKIVLIPLKEDTGSSGQMLCISAMRNRKPIIYTDVPSVNYYFAKETGYPYKRGQLDSIKNALKECLDNPIIASKFGENSYKESLKYTKIKEFITIDKILNI